MNYNEQHKHERDAFLHFDAEEHIYTCREQKYKSVTTLVGEFFQQFDADAHAPRTAKKLGISVEEVKEMWRKKGEAAANLGTQMHADIEQYYLATSEAADSDLHSAAALPASTDSAYQLFKLFAEQYHLKPFRTEWAIYDEESQIAGTLDMLDYQNGVYTLYDWKRSNKILSCGQPETVCRWGRHAFKPIAHIHDTTYWHYALQQSIYRYILEKNYAISIAKANLVVLHPDYIKPYVVEVPYLKEEVKALLNQR